MDEPHIWSFSVSGIYNLMLIWYVVFSLENHLKKHFFLPLRNLSTWFQIDQIISQITNRISGTSGFFLEQPDIRQNPYPEIPNLDDYSNSQLNLCIDKVIVNQMFVVKVPPPLPSPPLPPPPTSDKLCLLTLRSVDHEEVGVCQSQGCRRLFVCCNFPHFWSCTSLVLYFTAAHNVAVWFDFET